MAIQNNDLAASRRLDLPVGLDLERSPNMFSCLLLSRSQGDAYFGGRAGSVRVKVGVERLLKHERSG